jgi:hypothetical protein
MHRKMALKQDSDAPPVHVLRPDVQPELSGVIQRLLARDPADRYPTADEAATALDRWVASGPDFPARLFRPSHPSGDTDGEATEPGRDRDPTSLPPTRRITWQQTNRGAGGAEAWADCDRPITVSLELDPEEPASRPSPASDCPEPAQPGPSESELTGPPTARLGPARTLIETSGRVSTDSGPDTIPADSQVISRRISWWVIALAFAAAGLLVAAIVRAVG